MLYVGQISILEDCITIIDTGIEAMNFATKCIFVGFQFITPLKAITRAKLQM